MNYQLALPADFAETLSSQGWLLLSLPHEAREAIGETYLTATTFFQYSSNVKNSNRLPDDVGYRPPGIEYSQSPERPDPIESFTADLRSREAIRTLPSPIARKLYNQMLATIDVLEPLAESMVVKLARSYNKQNSSSLIGALRRWSCLQVNYSRPSATQASFIHERHEDGHLLTVLSSNQPGLEIEISKDHFLPIHPSNDQVLIMPGEILWLLTGGEIRPLYHRVRPHPKCSDRVALLFFVDMDPRFCDPWVRNELNESIDIGHRVLTNARRFGLDPYLPE